MPASGVPDAMAFCSLTAGTSVGAPIICQTDQQVLRGTLNNTARLPTVVLADNDADTEPLNSSRCFGSQMDSRRSLWLRP